MLPAFTELAVHVLSVRLRPDEVATTTCRYLEIVVHAERVQFQRQIRCARRNDPE